MKIITHITMLALAFCLVSTTRASRGFHPETVILDGKTYELRGITNDGKFASPYPMEAYFKEHPEKHPKTMFATGGSTYLSMSRGLRRPRGLGESLYKATYEVKDAQLFLKDIAVNHYDGVLPGAASSLGIIKPLKIDWISGTLKLKRTDETITLQIDKGNVETAETTVSIETAIIDDTSKTRNIRNWSVKITDDTYIPDWYALKPSRYISRRHILTRNIPGYIPNE